jgi:hypothetical protein
MHSISMFPLRFLEEEVRKLLVRRLLEHGLLPQVGRQKGVGVVNGGVRRLGYKKKDSINKC